MKEIKRVFAVKSVVEHRQHLARKPDPPELERGPPARYNARNCSHKAQKSGIFKNPGIENWR